METFSPPRDHSANQERGSALMEAAIVLPVFFLLTSGVIQFGYLYSQLITLRNASVVAAREAILGTNPTTTQVCAAARNALGGAMDPNLLTCQTTPSVLPVTTGTQVTVSLSYAAPTIISMRGGAPSSWTLIANSTMQ
jgi:hypothetical protein